MRTIDIAEILSPDLKSRMKVKAKVIPSHTPEIVFKDVNEFLLYVSNPVQ